MVDAVPRGYSFHHQIHGQTYHQMSAIAKDFITFIVAPIHIILMECPTYH